MKGLVPQTRSPHDIGLRLPPRRCSCVHSARRVLSIPPTEGWNCRTTWRILMRSISNSCQPLTYGRRLPTRTISVSIPVRSSAATK